MYFIINQQFFNKNIKKHLQEENTLRLLKDGKTFTYNKYKN